MPATRHMRRWRAAIRSPTVTFVCVVVEPVALFVPFDPAENFVGHFGDVASAVPSGVFRCPPRRDRCDRCRYGGDDGDSDGFHRVRC